MNRDSWTPFLNDRNEWIVTNGVLQLPWHAPPGPYPGFALASLGTDVAAELGNFYTLGGHRGLGPQR